MYELRVIGVWFVLRRLLVHPTMLFALGLFVRTAVNRHHNYRRRNLLFLPFQKLYSNSQELLINRFLIESLLYVGHEIFFLVLHTISVAFWLISFLLCFFLNKTEHVQTPTTGCLILKWDIIDCKNR